MNENNNREIAERIKRFENSENRKRSIPVGRVEVVGWKSWAATGERGSI